MKTFIKFFVPVICLLMIGTSSYSQSYKSVLLENYTSSTCGPCAANNPQLRQWISDHWSNLVAISYHVNWPSPGNDPMYLHNPTQVSARVTYYNVNSVPYGRLMGFNVYSGAPFNFADMTAQYNTYSGTTCPMRIQVTDTRISGDSNRANITLTNFTNLPVGNWALRVMVIERWVIYQSPPGTNGETQFQNVFRLALPNTLGTQCPITAGTYNFEFRYKINSAWQDTSIYTIAFVQDDNSKVALTTGRPGILTGIPPYSNEVPSGYSLSQNYPNPFNPITNIKFGLPKDEFVTLKVYDILGNEVKTLIEGNQKAGQYNLAFEGTNYASGIYFYTLKTNSFVETKKMTLIK